MLEPEKIKGQLTMKGINLNELVKECGVIPSVLSMGRPSVILHKTQLVLPKFAKILGENPFVLKKEECFPEEHLTTESSSKGYLPKKCLPEKVWKINALEQAS